MAGNLHEVFARKYPCLGQEHGENRPGHQACEQGQRRVVCPARRPESQPKEDGNAEKGGDHHAHQSGPSFAGQSLAEQLDDGDGGHDAGQNRRGGHGEAGEVLGDQDLVTGHPVGEQLAQAAALLLAGDAVVGQQQGHQRPEHAGDEDPVWIEAKEHRVGVPPTLESIYKCPPPDDGGHVRQAATVAAAGESQAG